MHANEPMMAKNKPLKNVPLMNHIINKTEGKTQSIVGLNCNKSREGTHTYRRRLLMFAVYLSETQLHNGDAISPSEGRTDICVRCDKLQSGLN